MCTEVVEDSSSAVPVVKLESEYVPMSRSADNSTCSLTAATDAADAKETGQILLYIIIIIFFLFLFLYITRGSIDPGG